MPASTASDVATLRYAASSSFRPAPRLRGTSSLGRAARGRRRPSTVACARPRAGSPASPDDRRHSGLSSVTASERRLDRMAGSSSSSQLRSLSPISTMPARLPVQRWMFLARRSSRSCHAGSSSGTSSRRTTKRSMSLAVSPSPRAAEPKSETWAAGDRPTRQLLTQAPVQLAPKGDEGIDDRGGDVIPVETVEQRAPGLVDVHDSLSREPLERFAHAVGQLRRTRRATSRPVMGRADAASTVSTSASRVGTIAAWGRVRFMASIVAI